MSINVHVNTSNQFAKSLKKQKKNEIIKNIKKNNVINWKTAHLLS